MTGLFELAYRFRGVLMAPVYIVLVTVFIGETESDAWIWPIGLSVFGTGVAIRVWAQMHLHYRLRVHKILTMTGPYVYVRNPIYIANTLMMLGLTILSELLWFLPAMLLWCVAVYTMVVRREERHLTEKYGRAYQLFLERIPRWVPRLSWTKGERAETRRFLLPSLRAEVNCLLLLLPLIGKEVYSNLWV